MNSRQRLARVQQSHRETDLLNRHIHRCSHLPNLIHIYTSYLCAKIKPKPQGPLTGFFFIILLYPVLNLLSVSNISFLIPAASVTLNMLPQFTTGEPAHDLQMQCPRAGQQLSSDLSKVWRDLVPWLWTEASGSLVGGGLGWWGFYVCSIIDPNGHFVLNPNMKMNTELCHITCLACGKGQTQYMVKGQFNTHIHRLGKKLMHCWERGDTF